MAPRKLGTKKFIGELIKDVSGVLKSMTVPNIAKLIHEANYAYYNTDKPLFSDSVYDVVFSYLKEKDPSNPVLKEVGSGVAKDDNRKETLPFYMGSLDKIKTDDKNALQKFSKKYSGPYILSDKLDGNSAMIYVDKGVMKIYSRGNGTIGQNVTNIAPYIRNIPKHLLEDVQKEKDKKLAVRGELIIAKDDFEKVKSKGANARNMVAGAINAKMPDIEILSLVQFVAYELIYPDALKISEQIEKLKCLGFTVVHNKLMTGKQFSTDNLSAFLLERREKSMFEIDGIVVFDDSKGYSRKNNDNPDYAFAFKSMQTLDKAETTVTRVEWNMSKDGYMIPVVIFTPVSLEGVVIQRASAFNGKFIKDNKLGPGSRVVIMRSGFVIPYISEVLSTSETGEAQMPEVEFSWSSSGVDIIVKDITGKPNEELLLKNLEYFFDKINVKGLSTATVKKLFNAGNKTPKDVFGLNVDKIKKIDGFKDKSATNLHNSLQTRMTELKTGKECMLLMDASNTLGRGIGIKKVELVFEHIPNLVADKYIPTIAELVAIKGIEKKTAQLLISHLPACYEFLNNNGFDVCFQSPSEPETSAESENGNVLVNQVIVFTGVRSKDAEAFINANGGKVASTVSKKTTLVIAKDVNGDSNSLIKARDLNIPIIALDTFLKKYMN